MLTRIELDGFKSFVNFTLDLGPFQVIIGANGVGKSNLFDALRLLAALAEKNLYEAFQEMRGDPQELFTLDPDGRPRDRMRLAVEMLVEPRVRDEWGIEKEIQHNRLRYEVEIVRRPDGRGRDRLAIAHESLRAIPRKGDAWLRRWKADRWLPKRRTGRTTPFISTEGEGDQVTVYLHQDGRAGRGRRASLAEQMERTALSGVTGAAEFPHVFAAREEMRRWTLLQLVPQVLRRPSPRLAPSVLHEDGGNLAAVLARLTRDHPPVLRAISAEMARLVPGIQEVRVEEDPVRDLYVLQAQLGDGRAFSSQVLSDGTLRLLALVTLKHDPEFGGVLCFEEPENGVHPLRVKHLIEVLRGMTTDLSDPDLDRPLRQVIVNTHSPVVAKEVLEDRPPVLLFATLVGHAVEGQGVLRLTRIYPVLPTQQLALEWEVDPKLQRYTYGQVLRYLETATFVEEARAP